MVNDDDDYDVDNDDDGVSNKYSYIFIRNLHFTFNGIQSSAGIQKAYSRGAEILYGVGC